MAASLSGCSTSSTSGDGGGSSAARDELAVHAPAGKRTAPSGDPAPPPEPDTCRNLTFGDINRFSNAAPTIPCNRPHTGYTFSVQQLPKDVAFDGVDIGNDAVQEKAAAACRETFTPYIGGTAATRALSRLAVTYFLPTQEDFDRGARWVRCDIIAMQSARILADLPDPPLKGFDGTDDALDEYGVCSRGEPGTTEGMLVMCNQEHTYRALAALRLGADGDPYPGDDTAKTTGQQRCDDYVSGALGLGGGYSYAWTYPSSEEWSKGQRFGYCWNKTAS
jgi:hypothetical protein